jgi:hypothetical protein
MRHVNHSVNYLRDVALQRALLSRRDAADQHLQMQRVGTASKRVRKRCHAWNEDAVCGCQMGSNCPILPSQQDKLYLNSSSIFFRQHQRRCGCRDRQSRACKHAVMLQQQDAPSSDWRMPFKCRQVPIHAEV